MREIKISEVLDLLEQGKTREEIQSIYGLSVKELKMLFSHPKLKGKKTKKAPSFILVDDLENEEGEVLQQNPPIGEDGAITETDNEEENFFSSGEVTDESVVQNDVEVSEWTPAKTFGQDY